VCRKEFVCEDVVVCVEESSVFRMVCVEVSSECEDVECRREQCS
jgi:hypothetical protein